MCNTLWCMTVGPEGYEFLKFLAVSERDDYFIKIVYLGLKIQQKIFSFSKEKISIEQHAEKNGKLFNHYYKKLLVLFNLHAL
jgi:hypothetical protein